MSDSRGDLKPIPLTRCRHITCKGMVVFGEEYLVRDDDVQRSHDFECTKTLNVLGPDHALVSLKRCDSSRACYEEL